MKILANDGISNKGKEKLEEAGFEVIVKKVAQDQLADFINKNRINVLLVRSATTVDKSIINSSISLRRGYISINVNIIIGTIDPSNKNVIW